MLKNSYSHIISKFDDNTTNVVKRSNNNVKKGNKVELLHSFFSKDAMKSFYLLNNGKFQEATLNQFRAGLQIGMFVDVYDTESSMWRLGTVKLLNGPEQQKVIALYGFTDRFDISLNREEAKRRLYPYRWHTKNLYYPKTKILNPLHVTPQAIQENVQLAI